MPAWWRWNVVPARHDDGVGRDGYRCGVGVPAAAGALQFALNCAAHDAGPASPEVAG